MLGRIDEAREAGAAAVDAARLSGNHHHLSWALWEYGLACWYGGDTGAARVALEESRELADETGRNILWESEPGWALATIMADEGDFGASLATTLRWCGGPELPLVVPAERCIGWDILTDTTIGLGQLDEAEAYVERLEGQPRRARWPRCWPSARGRRCCSRAETPARRRGPRARRCALARRRRGCSSRAGARRSCSAARWPRGGDRTGAIRELRDAELALDAGGAHTHRDEARRELRKLGHRVDQARRRGAPTDALAGLAALSAREREVVALVAAGRTNPAIAEELFLSVKTVETHLRNVFGKLGVASRAEVAAAFARNSDARLATLLGLGRPDRHAQRLAARQLPARDAVAHDPADRVRRGDQHVEPHARAQPLAEELRQRDLPVAVARLTRDLNGQRGPLQRTVDARAAERVAHPHVAELGQRAPS